MGDSSDEGVTARQQPEGTSGGGATKPPPAPKWVKVLGLASLFLLTLFVIAMLVQPGEHGPGRHRPSTGETNHDSEGHDAGPMGGLADPSETDRTIEISALDNPGSGPAFQPAAITVQAGETVTFLVRNEGQAVHEFTLGDSSAQQEHAQEMAKEGTEHEASNSIRMQPGETKTLTWRFGRAGTLEYACHEPGHYQAGMRGTITVS